MNINRFKRFFTVIGVSLTATAGLFAAGPRTVATTGWAAAFCHAAGLTDVHVLAPATLIHPPDYELKPSDIPVIMEADLIVFGGYEGMMKRIRAQIADTDTRMLRIDTTYEPSKLEASVRAIAEAAGTSAAAEAGIAAVRKAWAEARQIVTGGGAAGKSAVVHRFQAPFAAAVGLDVTVVFGPAPPGPRLIADAAATGAEIVVDNVHNPVAGPISEVLPNADTVELLNFPGTRGTGELVDVILSNARVLAEATK